MKITICVFLLILISIIAEASSLLSGASLCTDTDGVVIRDVKRNGKLWKVGIRQGDVILQIGSQEIKTLDDYVQKSKSINKKTVTMLFSSNGKEYKIVKKGDSYQRENIGSNHLQTNTTAAKRHDIVEDITAKPDKTQIDNQTSDAVDTPAKTTANKQLTTKEAYKRLAKTRKNVLQNSNQPTSNTSLDHSKADRKVSESPDRSMQDSMATAESYFVIGTDHNKRKHYRDAISAFRLAIKIRPDYAEAHRGIALACISLKHWKNALDASKKAVSTQPENAEAYFLMGIAYDNLGQEKESIKASKQAIRIKPDYMMAHLNIGAAYEKQSLWDEAIAAYQQAVTIKPEYAYGYYRIGLAYYNHSRLSESVGTYTVFYYIEPNESYIRLGYGNMAIEALKQAIRIKPDYVLAHFQLGIAYDEFGYADLAFQEYEILEALKQHRLAWKLSETNKKRQQTLSAIESAIEQQERDVSKQARLQYLRDKYKKTTEQ